MPTCVTQYGLAVRRKDAVRTCVTIVGHDALMIVHFSGHYLSFYNERRPYQALGYRTPKLV